MLTTAALFQLAMQCAPAVHPDTIHDITRTESGLNPYAIAEIVPVKGGRSRVISHLPSSKDEALKIVEAIKQKKHRYSVGLMQITSTNFPQFGVSTDCYQRGGTLQRALSCYYSGNFETGQRPESAFGNTSYVQRIGYVVPSTRAEQQTASPSSGEAPAVPSDNTVYPDSVIRGVIPAPDTTPTSIAAYPPHVVRGGLAVSSD